MTVANALSFDVEEWFHVNTLKETIARQEIKFPSLVCEQTHKVMSILDEFNVKATFFVLGSVACEHPELISEIKERGHEVGSHGFSHSLLGEQTPQEFKQDVTKSIESIKKACGLKPSGFRAPNFSITGDCLWALKILKDEEFTYDSSIYPTRLLHKNPAGAPQQPYRTEEGIIEFPASTTTILGLRIPYGGGIFLRTQPYSFTRNSITKANKEGIPSVVYTHPWELDLEHPQVKCSLKAKLIHYTLLSRTEEILRKLLTDFKFKPMKETLHL